MKFDLLFDVHIPIRDRYAQHLQNFRIWRQSKEESEDVVCTLIFSLSTFELHIGGSWSLELIYRISVYDDFCFRHLVKAGVT